MRILINNLATAFIVSVTIYCLGTVAHITKQMIDPNGCTFCPKKELKVATVKRTIVIKNAR